LVNPDEDFTAADFKAFAVNVINDIVSRGKLPIIVGGTGLYISALVDNLQFTDAPPNEEWRQAQEEISTVKLYERLQKFDRAGAEEIDSQNRRRVLRALEIVETTGRKLSDQQTKGEEKFDSLMIGVDRSREELYERIELRVDEMVAHGLVDEVRALRAKYGADVNAMTGIGYRQIGQFLDGYLKLRDTIDLIKRDTRRYAKRQLTWFRRDNRIVWLRPEEVAERVRNWIDG
ncbi:MAG: tRNA (adenosine(37)-N6)-dimethylallyltransferase MiaA, partial [bacterium]|nr:tRNA (adenosine(37)-N6)-dimethylallyltransferase MiaA [bacterium]